MKIKVTTILEVIDRHLDAMKKLGLCSRFEFDEDGLAIGARGCGWNDASIVDNCDDHMFECSYADSELMLDNADPQLLTKIGKWVVKIEKQIAKDLERFNRSR